MFHDASVIGFALTKQTFEMSLEDVFTSEGSVEATVSVSLVSKILVDHEPSNELKMLGDIGDILTLDIFDNRIYLLVEWTDFNPRKSTTRLYEIFGTDVQIKLIK